MKIDGLKPLYITIIMPPKSHKPTVQVVLLTQKAEVKSASLVTAVDGTINLAMVQALIKKKETIEILGSYKNKNQYLFLFGYTAGKAGTENKHELPPPHDTTLYFGDIVVIASKDPNSCTTPHSLSTAEYETFYTRAFGGFEELDSEEEEEEVIVEEEPEVAEEEEEEEEDDGDEEAEQEGEEGGEDTPAPIQEVVKKRTKRGATTNTVVVGGAQVYSAYHHVAVDDELVGEPFTAEYNEHTLCSQRKHFLGVLKGLFSKEDLTEKEIQELERCIYNATINAANYRHIGKAWSHHPFVELYKMVAKHITVNFHPSSYVENTELFSKYKAGEVTLKDISEMDTYQMFEERWKDSFLQQQVREKRQLEGNKSMATDRFLCRCGKRECTYYELQTRSADEPMTIFITCLACGKHWRQ